MAVGLFRDRFVVDLTALNVLAGVGLLRLRRGWRTFVVLELWLAFAAVGLFGGVLLSDSPSVTCTVYGIDYGMVPPAFGWLAATGMLAIAAWAYWVLTRPKTRMVFLARADRPATSGETGDSATHGAGNAAG
jgi:hypothetical protein